MRLALHCGGYSSIAQGRQIILPARPDSYFVRTRIYLRHGERDGTVVTISVYFVETECFLYLFVPLQKSRGICQRLFLRNSILRSMTVSGKLVGHQTQDGKCRYERNCKIECAKAISSVVCATERRRIRDCLEHCTCMAIDGA